MIVPIILNEFVNKMPNRFDQVEPTICVSLLKIIATIYIKVVINATEIITANAILTIILINSNCVFCCKIVKSLSATSLAFLASFKDNTNS
jgi:hypothetical protein